MNNSWFSHDSNARNSKKLIRLRQKHGAEGYGVYWMLIERLREEDGYTSETDYDMIAFDLRVDAGLIRSVVEDFGLFEVDSDGGVFSCHGLVERMEAREAKSAAGRKGAMAKWGKEKTTSEMAPDGKTMADEMAKCDSANGIKGKERKEKKRNNYSSSLSSSFSSEAEEESGEEKQQEEFLSEMFFKNWASPCKELQKFIDFNNTGGRLWAKMSTSERESAFRLWEQKPAKPPRFRSDELSVLRRLYSTLKERNAAKSLVFALLDDGVRVVSGSQKMKIVLPKNLYDHFVGNRAEYEGVFREINSELGLEKIILDHYAAE